MKSIRLKVRTILLLVFLTIIGMVFSDQIYFYGIGVINVFLGDDHKIAYQKLDTSTLEAEMMRLERILDDHQYGLINYVTISEGMSISSARFRSQDANKILDKFYGYKNEVLDKGAWSYYLNVILSQWFSGNVEVTHQLMDEIPLDRLSKEEKDHYYLVKSSIHLTYYQLEEVENALYLVSETYIDRQPYKNIHAQGIRLCFDLWTSRLSF